MNKMIKKTNGKEIDSDIEYVPEMNHNEEIRRKYPKCAICEDKLIENEQQILIPEAESDRKYIGVLCSDKCMKQYIKEHQEWYKKRKRYLIKKKLGIEEEDEP